MALGSILYKNIIYLCDQKSDVRNLSLNTHILMHGDDGMDSFKYCILFLFLRVNAYFVPSSRLSM